MPRHSLKLLALIVAITVAPATAGHRTAGSKDSSCPYEQARLAALAAAIAAPAPVAQTASRRKAPTRITLVDRLPADGSLLGLGRNSGFVSP